MARRAFALWLAAALSGCATVGAPQGAALAPGARYVAMGSSFAAGPATGAAAGTSGPCGRWAGAYPGRLAERRGLALVDVSCSGATTAHVLGPWNELPPQIDAVTPDTRLVTITIGGNDIGYIGGLMASACRREPGERCGTAIVPDERGWAADEAALHAIARAARTRAPGARIVFVDYLTILPPRGTCAALGLTAAEADAGRQTARRLATLTARVAKAEDVSLLQMSQRSRGHDACSAAPWTNGAMPPPYREGGFPFHPTAAGMRAVAAALDRAFVAGK